MAGEEELERIRQFVDSIRDVFGKLVETNSLVSSSGKQASEGLKATKKTLLQIGDVARHLGGASRQEVANLHNEYRKLSKMQKDLTAKLMGNNRGTAELNKQYRLQQGQLVTVSNAMNKYGQSLQKIGLDSAAAGVSLGNLFKQVPTGVGKETIAGWKAAAASMITPGKKASAVLGMFAPVLKKTSETSNNALANFTFMAGGLGAAFTFLLGALQRTMKGTFATQRVMTGALSMQDASFGKSMTLYTRMALGADFWGIKQEEQIGLLKTLTSAYAINATSQRDLVGASGMAAMKALAFGDALNLTTEESAKTIATMKLFGTATKALPISFVRLKNEAVAAGLTVSHMAGVLNELAPLSLLAANAHTRIIGVFAQMGQTIDRSLTDPMLKFVTQERHIRLTADAMQAFAKAAAKMTLPEVVAFGGGLGLGASSNLADAMEAAMGKTRPDMLLNMYREVSKTLPGGQRDVLAGMTAFIATQQGVALETAARMAEITIGTKAEQQRLASSDVTERERAQEAQLERFAVISSTIEDPMQKLIGIAQSILGILLDLVTKLIGNRLVGMLAGGARRQ